MNEQPKTPSAPGAQEKPAKNGLKQKICALPKSTQIMIGVCGVLALVLVVGGIIFASKSSDEPKTQNPSGVSGNNGTGTNNNQDLGRIGSATSTDAVERGKYLSLNGCSGTGSKKLGSAPMNTADISVILPYGLVAGGHVTPVDHQYFYGKNQSAAPSTYDVMAPADGNIVNVEVRPRGNGKADMRVVISYSCTFFSYFDLANSLSDDIAAKMPKGWETINGPQAVKIPVKEGQVVAKVGGQSLDYAVWDTTKTLSGLLVPIAYNNYEPWKINTVKPLDYYTDKVKAQLLPLYVRTAEPRDGVIGHDVDGTASGSWFKKGTNGYIGATTEKDFSSQSYADGHLSLAPDLYDGANWVFSTGAVNHGTQYAIKSATVAPDKLDTTKGIVKYELVQYGHIDQTGAKWFGGTVTSVKLDTSGPTMATALVQLTGKRELKVEIVLGKAPTQVNGFSSAAATYTRGDDATIMTRGQ